MRVSLLAFGLVFVVGGVWADDVPPVPDSETEIVPERPRRERWPQPALGGSRSGDPEILFTFDDGPHQDYLPDILDTLKKHGVQTIFFATGWRISQDHRGWERRRALLDRALSEGHLVGNHTVTHAKLCNGTEKTAAWEIDENTRLLQEVSGLPVLFFRAPYGVRCKRLERMLRRREMSHLHWDMDPHEYEHHDAGQTLAYFKKKISRLEGRGVVLLHDTKRVTVKALPLLLDWIAEENQRRLESGKRPIRILSYTDVIRERLPPGLLPLLEETGRETRDLVPRITDRLLGPLSGAPEHAGNVAGHKHAER